MLLLSKKYGILGTLSLGFETSAEVEDKRVATTNDTAGVSGALVVRILDAIKGVVECLLGSDVGEESGKSVLAIYKNQ